MSVHVPHSLRQHSKRLAALRLWIWICVPGFAPQELQLRGAPECALHWRGNPGRPGQCWTRTQIQSAPSAPPLCPIPRNWPGSGLRLRLRAAALSRIDTMTQGGRPSTRGFWARLILRVPSSVDERIQEDLQRSLGFVHLWSASGIHLWALALSVSGLIVLLTERWCASAPLWGRVAGLGVCTWAWILADCGAGMLRPLLILALRSWTTALGVRWRMWSPLALALGIEAAFGIFQTGSLSRLSGRWHYAAAVGFGLMGLEAARSGPRSRAQGLREHAMMALGSWIPIALFECVTRGWTAVLTPIWSLLTVPLLAQIAFPLGFWGGAFPATPGISAALDGVDSFVALLTQVAMSGAAIWHVTPGAAAAGLMVGTLSFALSHSRRSRITKSSMIRATLFSAGLVIAVLRLGHTPMPRADVKAQAIQQLSVGQGDAALIHWDPARTVLLDTGPPGGLLLSQLLTAWRPGTESRLTTLALTHQDLDHRGGVPTLARWVDWDCLLTPETWPKTLPESRPRCAVPGFWAAIHPDSAKPSRNQSMLGALIPLPGALYLNLGDADKRGEQKLWTQLESNIPLLFQSLSSKQPIRRILKASHHGSGTSTSPALLSAYQPTEVWISAGRRNSYGHPHPEVLRALRSREIPFRSTQENPALAISD